MMNMSEQRAERSSRAPHSGGTRATGFTLIEMMVTVAVAAILLVMAVPSFQEASLNGKLNSISNSFVAAAQLARSEAIKRNANVTLCASSNGTSCIGTGAGSWAGGWIVLAGTNVVSRQQPLTPGFELNGERTLVYQSTGLGATANLTVCRASPSVGAINRTIGMLAGRASVTKGTTTSCP